MKKLLMLTAVIATAIAVRAQVTPIDGDNDVGFISVPVPTTGLKVLSVPFEACLGSGEAGVLSDLVSTNGMKGASSPADADQLVVLTTNEAGQSVYYYYWHKAGYGWETNNTIRLGEDTPEVESPEPASTFKVARGLGFWLKRASDATGTELYMQGQLATVSVPVMLDGGTNFTLIGLGALTTTNLNQVSAANWGSRYDGGGAGNMDKLLVVTNANGSYVQYIYRQSLGKWIDVNQPDGEPQVAIQPGEGFWYQRRAVADLEFTPVVSE
ncbi:MAG: hypothetical protein FJ222_03920 [Lentisphaerae bacterium]|nr:hypothetical protein [Lentisphaerota bacterium]